MSHLTTKRRKVRPYEVKPRAAYYPGERSRYALGTVSDARASNCNSTVLYTSPPYMLGSLRQLSSSPALEPSARAKLERGSNLKLKHRGTPIRNHLQLWGLSLSLP